MRFFYAHHRGFAWGIVALAGCVLALPAFADLYTIPEGRDTDTMKSIVNADIPDQLNKANCGFRITDEHELDYMTTVNGVPLRPDTWHDRSTGASEDNPYPQGAYGKSFAAYHDNPYCEDFRSRDLPEYNENRCTDPNQCQNICDAVNADMRYSVERIAACDVQTAVYAPVFDDDGNVVDWTFDHCETTSFRTDEVAGDCNSCPASSPECDPTVETREYFGEKYECTGDWEEQQSGLLRVGYGWVWDGDSPALENAADWCKALWTKEQKEYPNCTDCKGSECRSAPEVPSPVKDPQYDPLNGSRYDSFYRRYVATHTLADIPQTNSTEENDKNIEVNLACYKWYKEADLDPSNPGDRACIADDLQLYKLTSRKMEKGNEEWNKQESSSSAGPCTAQPWPGCGGGSCPPGQACESAIGASTCTCRMQSSSSIEHKAGGFTLDPAHKNDSTFSAPALPETETGRILGETQEGKYVTAMNTLERRMEGLPPTIQLILPSVKTRDELALLFPPTDPDAQPSPLTDITVPLRPGLIEAVREVLRHAIFSRIREEPIPVVVPLLSETELQSAIEAWEGWKKEGELNPSLNTTGTDAIIAKLQEYRRQMQDYRKMRAALPSALAAALTRREELSQAVDEWVASRLAPYQQAMISQDAVQRLVGSWRNLKEKLTNIVQLNQQYCKNDMTSAFLPWLEKQDNFEPPEIPPETPRHLVFDFSNVFIEGAEEAAAIRVPVFRVVQVAIKLPLPPLPHPDPLPDLPPVPELPELSTDPIDISKEYETEPTPEIPLNYEELANKFDDLANQLSDVRQQYDDNLWTEEQHEDFSCPNPGSDGCVFPETKLWNVFMRIWSPIGAFLDFNKPPVPPPLYPLGPSSQCPAGDDQCLLQEQLLKRGLRVTLPKESEGNGDAYDPLRLQMRQQILDDDGKLIQQGSDVPLFEEKDDRLFESYPVPRDVPLFTPNSSSSSAP